MWKYLAELRAPGLPSTPSQPYERAELVSRRGSLDESNDYESDVDRPSTTQLKRQRAGCLGRRFQNILLISGVVATTFALGRSSKDLIDVKLPALSVAGVQINSGNRPYDESPSARCDPYALPGVLVSNPARAAGNYYEPVSADCNSTDYLSLFVGSMGDVPELEFMRGRTIVVMGDSIDRGNLVDACLFMGGTMENILTAHELTTPLPEGRERPVGQHDRLGAEGDGWADSEESRPHLCTVMRYNFRMINFFHYGYQREEDEDIVTRSHFYPPGRIEDRIDQIIVPMLAKMERLNNYPGALATPDIFSITPGFWHIFREVLADDAERNRLIADGVDAHTLLHLDDVATMSKPRRADLEVRMQEVLQHIANTWAPVTENGSTWKTAIFWRTLHHIKFIHIVPYNRIQTVDQIGRRVIGRLFSDSNRKNTLRGKLTSMKSWMSEVGVNRNPDVWAGAKGAMIEKDLGSRIVLDPWGELMLGQEGKFRDLLHPLPLPGGRLYGNMLLDKLRRVVEARTGGTKAV